LDNPVDFGEQGVIPSDTDVVTRFEGRATLPHQDTAGSDFFPGKPLDAETLAFLWAIFKSSLGN
jgi:hypothetical protein